MSNRTVSFFGFGNFNLQGSNVSFKRKLSATAVSAALTIPLLFAAEAKSVEAISTQSGNGITISQSSDEGFSRGSGRFDENGPISAGEREALCLELERSGDAMGAADCWSRIGLGRTWRFVIANSSSGLESCYENLTGPLLDECIDRVTRTQGGRS